MSELNFACLDIVYIHSTASILISTFTNNPCHLTLYHTDKEPRRHPTTRTIRGLEVPWGTYFCFVAWHAVEQNEAGDTLFHTFNVSPWTHCETKYFTMRGTAGGLESPSCSAIFKHHHPGVSELTLVTQIGSDTEDLRAFGTTCQSCPAICPPLVSAGYLYAHRLHMGSGYRFNITHIPRGATIVEAKLKFTCWQNSIGACRYTRLRAEQAEAPPDFAGLTWATLMPRWWNSGVFIDWDWIPLWIAETEYESIDISPVIQQLVNHSWWKLSQPLVLFWEDWDERTPHLVYDVRRAFSYNVDPSKAAQIRIKWQF